MRMSAGGKSRVFLRGGGGAGGGGVVQERGGGGGCGGDPPPSGDPDLLEAPKIFFGLN